MVISSSTKSRHHQSQLMVARNDSSNSTVPVDDVSPSSSKRIGERSITVEKSVRFNECQNQYFANSVRCAEDCPESWYEKVDYTLFKEDARDIVLDLMEDEDLVRLLEDLYRVCCQVDFVLEDASDLISSKDTSRLLKKLSKVYNTNTSNLLDLHLHGLEYHVACSIQQACSERNEKIQDIVQDVQVEQEHGLWTPGEMEEELRDSCLLFSQPSALFAQLLALAMAGKKKKASSRKETC